MLPVPGGPFLMGSNRFYPEEGPVHRAEADALVVDVTPVTNDAFAAFVAATRHVTVAEQSPSAEEIPDADPELMVPGSLVFAPPAGPVPLDDWTRWWAWVPGADWRHPTGPDSDLEGMGEHPVVHVGFEDALAYAAWAGKRLATEAEWEHAARGGLDGATYAWGEQFRLGGVLQANTFHGDFPWRSADPLGFDRTSPVGSFPANGFGLHDMIGNVWEWTSTPWSINHLPGNKVREVRETVPAAGHACCGPAPSTAEAGLGEHAQRVMKGGSHLCAPSYCRRYRPAARQGHEVRSTTSHLGFRCVRES